MLKKECANTSVCISKEFCFPFMVFFIEYFETRSNYWLRYKNTKQNKTVRLCFGSIILTNYSVLCYDCCSTFSDYLLWIQHMIAEGRITKSNKHIIFIDYFQHKFIANLNLSQIFCLYFFFFWIEQLLRVAKFKAQNVHLMHLFVTRIVHSLELAFE